MNARSPIAKPNYSLNAMPYTLTMLEHAIPEFFKAYGTTSPSGTPRGPMIQTAKS
jgi:hypothetical protein